MKFFVCLILNFPSSVLYQQDSLESEDAREFLDPNKFAEDGTTALQQAEFSEVEKSCYLF
jgi:hypothetical protein